jgi:Ca-activated chloride channel family protein
MTEFHFLRPAWFLALVPALLLLVLLWRRRGHGAAWRAFVSPALLPHLLLHRDQSVRRLPLVLLGVGWLLAVTALAGPTWERQPQPVYRAPADRVMVLDMSPSMAATDLKPDRLTRAHYVIRDLLSGVQEGRTALVVFGAEPHVVAPLTDDVATIEALLPALSVDILPVPGDRAGPALRTAGELLQRVGSTRGQVLLLSDGIDDPAASLEVIDALRGRGVQLSVLGVGTPEGAPLPAAGGGFEAAPDGGVRLARLEDSGLLVLARAGGGRYLRLGEGQPSVLLGQDVERGLAGALEDEQGIERWVEKGPWLLLPLLLIAAGGFRRGWLGVLVLLAIPVPQVQAFGWQDLWLRPDQQASRLLEQGEAAAAAERFRDPGWRATARYRAGDFAAAAEEFNGEDPDSSYNRGNALARAGRLPEALAAYDQALQQQPGNEDARFNRELIEKLLQEQQPQSGQGGSSDLPRDEQQAGTDQGDGADKGEPQETAGSQTEQGEAGDTGSMAQPGQSQAGSGEEEHSRSAGGERPEQMAGEGVPLEDRGVDPVPGQAGEAEQARADIAASVDDATPEHSDAQPAETAHDRQTLSTGLQQQEPMSEQDIALEQWLRQVPDDPAGLLRRKFLLEHLLRQKGHQTP